MHGGERIEWHGVQCDECDGGIACAVGFLTEHTPLIDLCALPVHEMLVNSSPDHVTKFFGSLVFSSYIFVCFVLFLVCWCVAVLDFVSSASSSSSCLVAGRNWKALNVTCLAKFENH